MLVELIESLRDEFAISAIQEAHALAQCHRTSFVWSTRPGTLCLAANKRYFARAVGNPHIVGVIAPPAACVPGPHPGVAIITSTKADELFYALHNASLHTRAAVHAGDRAAIHGQSIAPSARISATAVIGDDVVIGDNVVIRDRCIVLSQSILGPGCVLHENVTIGTEGFFSKVIRGVKTHVQHFGGVQLGANCTIHSGSNISRSVNESEFTILGNHVHVGVQSNIGHDCTIGDHSDISAKVCLAGRVRLGESCWIGAGAIVSNEVTIGRHASVRIGAIVVNDVGDSRDVSGNFAVDHAARLRQFVKDQEKG